MTQLTSRADLPDLARALGDSPWVAVDTEFHAEHRYLPRIFLLQLHLPGAGVHLLDPTDPEVIPPLAEALGSTPWIVHAGRQDLRVLQPLLGQVPEEVWDTQVVAGLLGPTYPAGYADLVQQHLGVELPKQATLSDWSRRPLSARQLEYAADDVRLLPALWERLEEGLERAGRRELARAACRSARDGALAPAPPDRLWERLPAASALDGPALSALQELCAWREARAREADHPARSVLSDGLLVDLARRRPRSVGEILANRRFPRKIAQRLGGPILACIARAEARPEPARPRPIRPQSEAARALDLLRLALEVEGAREGWSARLVCPDTALRAIVLAEDPLAAAAVALEDWQWRLVEPPLRAALDGELALRLDRSRATSFRASEP